MSDLVERSIEEYEEAAKIIRILIDAKIITQECATETYMNVYNAAFKILDLNKQE